MPSIPFIDHAFTVKELKSVSYNNRAQAATFASKESVLPWSCFLDAFGDILSAKPAIMMEPASTTF
jgi:hypothetical protein